MSNVEPFPESEQLQWLIRYWTNWLQHHDKMLSRGYNYTFSNMRFTSPVTMEQVDKVTATEHAIEQWKRKLKTK